MAHSLETNKHFTMCEIIFTCHFIKTSKSLSYCGSEDRHKSFQDEKVKDEDSLKSLITFKQQLWNINHFSVVKPVML